MHSTRKRKQWYFGMKIHVGADVNSGLVHTVSVTPANVPDNSQLPDLLREDDRAVLGIRLMPITGGNGRQGKRVYIGGCC